MTHSATAPSEARLTVAAPTRAQDHWSVNIAEPWEIHFWTREFACSEEALRGAVAAVGRSAGAVRSHLQARR